MTANNSNPQPTENQSSQFEGKKGQVALLMDPDFARTLANILVDLNELDPNSPDFDIIAKLARDLVTLSVEGPRF